LICIRGSALASFDSRSNTLPSSGLAAGEAGKLTVICAEPRALASITEIAKKRRK
jgi:hypothetical protein